MGADDEIDSSAGEPVDGCSLLGRSHEARQQPDGDGKGPEALVEGSKVLRGEDGGRNEHRNLLAILDGLERRPQGDLGLAVANVADDEAVHRLDGLHVELDLGGGA